MFFFILLIAYKFNAGTSCCSVYARFGLPLEGGLHCLYSLSKSLLNSDCIDTNGVKLGISPDPSAKCHILMKKLKDIVRAGFSKRYIIVESVAETETAAHKDENEDSIVSWNDEKLGVFCVADGIGGAPGGRQASEQIVDSISDRCKGVACDKDYENFRDSVVEAICEANTRIYDNDVKGMGATVVVLTMEPARGVTQVMHAGDSRLYRFRNKSLKRLTKDHSVAAQMGYGDSDTLPQIIRGRITNAIGIRKDLVLKKSWLRVRSGDVYLLCSDGLIKHVKDDEIASVLRETTATGIESSVKRLLDTTRRRGAADDVSVILIRIGATADDRSLLNGFSFAAVSVFLTLLLIGVFCGIKGLRERNAQRTVHGVTQANNTSQQKFVGEETTVLDPDSEKTISTNEVSNGPRRSDIPPTIDRETVGSIDATPAPHEDAIQSKSAVNRRIEMDLAGNWKMFGNGLLDSNTDYVRNEIELDVGWPASTWGIGVMFTTESVADIGPNSAINIEIRSERGSQTRVYAGVSTLDDANLELDRRKAKPVTQAWQKFTFPVSEMVGAKPERTSRTFQETDLMRIQSYKLLFTKPDGGIKYDKIRIRNPKISF